MIKGILAAVLCMAAQTGTAQTYYDKIRIGWDFRKQELVCGGVYSRLKVLSDGTLACVYSAGPGVYIRHKGHGYTFVFRNSEHFGAVRIRHSESHDIASRIFKPPDLLNGAQKIFCRHICHRLHGYGI